MDEEFKIESGIKISSCPRSKWAELFLNMKVGDSILFPTASAAQMLTLAARGRGRVSRRKQAGGFRVWRIK